MNNSQNRDFIDAVISQYLLDEAIDYIAFNYKPEDVFSDEQLDEWAKDNGYYNEED